MIVGGAVDFGGTADGLTTGGDDLVTGCDGLVTGGDGLVTGGDVFATGAVTSFLGSTVSTCQRRGLAMETKMNGSGISIACKSSFFPMGAINVKNALISRHFILFRPVRFRNIDCSAKIRILATSSLYPKT
jgi:hypothetical protein